jgi:spore coat protein H
MLGSGGQSAAAAGSAAGSLGAAGISGASGSAGTAGVSGQASIEDASVVDAANGGAPSDAEVVAPGVQVFDRDVLHEVSITVAPSDLPSLDERTDTRVPATLVFDGVTLMQVGVRNKGATSFQPVTQKPGFSIKLDEFVQGQKLDGLKKLVLNNTVQDPTWCNEILTYDTYRKAGLPAPRVAHAVVSLNGEPKGIYTISEAINAQFLARHYGAEFDQGNLYEGPWDFTKSVEDVDLKDEVEELRSRDDLRALTDVVLSEADATYPDRLASVLDVDQFILGYAIDVVTVAWDGYAYDAWNFYLYDHPGDNRFVFLPSGANWPYFRDAAGAAPTIDPMELPQLWGGSDPVGFLANERVRQIPVLHDRYVEQLIDVNHNAFDVAALHAEFDRLRTVLHSTTRTDDATQRDLRTFDEHVEMAYDFVADRKAYLIEQGY